MSTRRTKSSYRKNKRLGNYWQLKRFWASRPILPMSIWTNDVLQPVWYEDSIDRSTDLLDETVENHVDLELEEWWSLEVNT